MTAEERSGRSPRADVRRNRTALLNTAQRHFRERGVHTSLEAIARETGVGPATLYRHFPTRDELLAAVLQMNSVELESHRIEIANLDAPAEALDRWLHALEDYFSVFHGLSGPLMTAVQRPDIDNPLTIPCDSLVLATQQFVSAAQSAGLVRPEIIGIDLFLAACSLATIKSNGADDASLARLRSLIASGYRQSAMS
ncbi:TetR/AcrR family transcriptional regulator [Rhodococcus qingshengii]|uniref:TetR/AcrR family transcriptional regulator n=1 Tax=Rhodococcus qingshengii TaxID=334542 RepID=UPI0010A68F95|nr:TetR/AcrR family transcriptional regulator [Rhodococcus qingshengii]THJ64715.1 TetR/AcrR family transcriptional regulator [Rhodococcus qingshengii]